MYLLVSKSGYTWKKQRDGNPRQERTLDAVAWTPWLGVSAATPPHMRKEQGPRERFVLSWRAVRGSS
jgi:hypothetical protein